VGAYLWTLVPIEAVLFVQPWNQVPPLEALLAGLPVSAFRSGRPFCREVVAGWVL
jgi:hypothetical protein